MAKSKKRPLKKTAVTEKKNEKDPREKLTWKYWLGGAFGVIVFAALLILAANLLAEDDRMRFTEENGMLVREDGRIFLKASDVYAVRDTIGNDYGVTDKGNPIYKVGFKNDYGKLMEMDSDNYLTDGKGTLYYGELAVLPSLASFRTDCVYVVSEKAGEMTVALMSLTNEERNDAESFVQEYLSNTRYVGEGEYVASYTLYLTSSVYEHLYYILYLEQRGGNEFYVYSDEDPSSIRVSSRYFSELIAPDGTTGPAVTTAGSTAPAAPAAEAEPEA